LPIGDEQVNLFKVAQIETCSPMCCHNKCKVAIQEAGENWEKLPPGPLRQVYEEAANQQPLTANPASDRNECNKTRPQSSGRRGGKS